MSLHGKYDHITPTLKRLHWLPVEFRIKYKICLLTFNALSGHGPLYLSEMLTTRNVHYGLRPHKVLTLNIPLTKWKTLGIMLLKWLHLNYGIPYLKMCAVAMMSVILRVN